MMVWAAQSVCYYITMSVCVYFNKDYNEWNH